MPRTCSSVDCLTFTKHPATTMPPWCINTRATHKAARAYARATHTSTCTYKQTQDLVPLPSLPLAKQLIDYMTEWQGMQANLNLQKRQASMYAHISNHHTNSTRGADTGATRIRMPPSVLAHLHNSRPEPRACPATLFTPGPRFFNYRYLSMFGLCAPVQKHARAHTHTHTHARPPSPTWVSMPATSSSATMSLSCSLRQGCAPLLAVGNTSCCSTGFILSLATQLTTESGGLWVYTVCGAHMGNAFTASQTWCVLACVQACVRERVCALVYMRVFVLMCARAHPCVQACVCACMCVCARACVYMCACVCVCALVCECVCVCVCAHVLLCCRIGRDWNVPA